MVHPTRGLQRSQQSPSPLVLGDHSWWVVLLGREHPLPNCQLNTSVFNHRNSTGKYGSLGCRNHTWNWYTFFDYHSGSHPNIWSLICCGSNLWDVNLSQKMVILDDFACMISSCQVLNAWAIEGLTSSTTPRIMSFLQTASLKYTWKLVSQKIMQINIWKINHILLCNIYTGYIVPCFPPFQCLSINPFSVCLPSISRIRYMEDPFQGNNIKPPTPAKTLELEKTCSRRIPQIGSNHYIDSTSGSLISFTTQFNRFRLLSSRWLKLTVTRCWESEWLGPTTVPSTPSRTTTWPPTRKSP